MAKFTHDDKMLIQTLRKPVQNIFGEGVLMRKMKMRKNISAPLRHDIITRVIPFCDDERGGGRAENFFPNNRIQKKKKMENALKALFPVLTLIFRVGVSAFASRDR